MSKKRAMAQPVGAAPLPFLRMWRNVACRVSCMCVIMLKHIWL